jgi:hypothetical protein
LLRYIADTLRWTSQTPAIETRNVAVDLAINPCVTAVDKSEVFALKLNRRKFAKNPNDLIRCKFSIDAGWRDAGERPGSSTISKPYPFRPGNLPFTIRTE